LNIATDQDGVMHTRWKLYLNKYSYSDQEDGYSQLVAEQHWAVYLKWNLGFCIHKTN